VAESKKTIPSLNELANDWATYTINRFHEQLLKKRIGKTGSLKDSLAFRAIVGAGGDIEKIKMAYLNYGKFIDMGVGRGQALGNVRGNAEVYRAAGLKGPRKAKKWYSKTMYSETNILADLLMNNYGIRAGEMVKESFPAQINISI